MPPNILSDQVLLERIHEGNSRISNPREEAIIVVGGTRESKTTLVRLMTGLNIEVYVKKDTGQIALKEPDNDANVEPQIG
jgi:hypothetical protein